MTAKGGIHWNIGEGGCTVSLLCVKWTRWRAPSGSGDGARFVFPLRLRPSGRYRVPVTNQCEDSHAGSLAEYNNPLTTGHGHD